MSTSNTQAPPSGAPPAYSASQADKKQIDVTMDKDAIAQLLRDTFQQVAKHSKETLNAFSDVQAKLANIQLIGTSHKLYTDWVVIHENFRTVLWQSKNTASQISGRMKSFRKTLIPLTQNNQLDVNVKITIIQKFMEGCDKSQKEATNTSDDFAKVITAVKTYEGSFDNFSGNEFQEYQKSIADITKEIENLDTSLQELKKEVDSSRSTTKGLVIALCFLNPVVGLGLLAYKAATGWKTDIGPKVIEKQQKIDKLKNDLKAYQTNVDTVDSARKQLTILRNAELKTIKGKVEFFVTAWSAINSACVQLKERIGGTQDFVEIPEYIKQEMKSTSEMFELITYGLDAYAVGIVVDESKK